MQSPHRPQGRLAASVKLTIVIPSETTGDNAPPYMDTAQYPGEQYSSSKDFRLFSLRKKFPARAVRQNVNTRLCL
jgi:hypothetical protein